jgi:hypothetical protein
MKIFLDIIQTFTSRDRGIERERERERERGGREVEQTTGRQK